VRVVVALGGNALLRRGEPPEAMIGRLEDAVDLLDGTAGTLVTPDTLSRDPERSAVVDSVA